jgi:hypothetical protein
VLTACSLPGNTTIGDPGFLSFLEYGYGSGPGQFNAYWQAAFGALGGFRKLPTGDVEFEGFIRFNSGTPSNAVGPILSNNLPVGFRPARTQQYRLMRFSGTSTYTGDILCTVNTDGSIVFSVVGAAVGVNEDVYIHPIRYFGS